MPEGYSSLYEYRRSIRQLEKEMFWPIFIFKIILIGALVWFGAVLWFEQPPFTLIDNVNLIFHEFGHIVFFFGGETIAILGGTIFQFVVPITLLLYFMLRRDFFSVGAMIFWIGENFLYSSHYIKDALFLRLPLVGGGVHDWRFLLTKWDALDQAVEIGQAVANAGFLMLLFALLIMVLQMFISLTRKLVVKREQSLVEPPVN